MGVNSFAHPERFWLLLVVLPLWAWGQWKQRPTVVRVAFAHPLGALLPSAQSAKLWRWLKRALQFLILTALVALTAQPQFRWQEQDVVTHGVDIMIALDTSGSMAAEDMPPNRLESSKRIASEFIAKRDHDRIGLVVFGERSFTKCPATLDHEVLLNLVNGVTLGEAGDGTAIGMALVSALNRLRESDAKSQIVIVITDGDNNAGALGPKEAAELARDMGIKVYTIGIGSEEGAPIPIIDAEGRKHYALGPDGRPYMARMNVEDLVSVADTTQGRFYRAPNAQKLKAIFGEIDKLEKSKIESQVQHKSSDRFQWLGWLTLAVLLGYRYLTHAKLRFAS